MNLYLSPNGRIDQSTYWRGVIILFVISTVLSVVSAYASPFLGMLGIVFIWPWIVLHVKRFHDADMTGWVTVGMVVLAIVLSMVLGLILPGLFGVDTMAMSEQMTRDMEDMAASNDPGAMIAATMEATKKMAQAQLLPNILSTAIVTGVVGFVMSLFKSTPGTNKFGPPPGGPSEETFA
ncbi:MAG: DUF805 domain-containing protein [Hyphomonas sp.]|uniref:DUF805 domain-containing protein n=1 Tax=Hyphomonas sp. BRH_c22 TaxID=1629710 RepID=UPI000B04E307|nr:DUF805 domain-containing protein [Hyphomonas sp. BRH_c22]